jgi:hypothetical protein
MTDKDAESGIKVTDKRRFTSEGETRAGAPPDIPRPEPPPPAEAKAADKRPPIDFLTFIASLATNALAALGALPPEQSGGLPKNPELGREYIDILTLLRDKTRGNLSPQEDATLQRILTDLRMVYVRTTEGTSVPNSSQSS